MKDFICEKFEVDNPDETMVFGKTEHVVFDLAVSNVFFVGLRGSGKTTIAQQVAKKLNVPFVDTDRMVEDGAGKSIKEIVAEKGWEEFRSLESAVLARVCSDRGQIVATGGGIVLSAKNRELLQHSGTSFYLMGNPPLLANRIEQDGTTGTQRPVLSDSPLREEMSELLWEREPLYMMVAAHTLQAEKNVDGLVGDVIAALWPEGR
ncbi:shikimate kinase AroL [Desulfoplanes sp.]